MMKKCILWVLVLYLSVQIFSFSGANGQSSDQTSQSITRIVMQVVKSVYPISYENEPVLFEFLHTLIRKTAHFLEYMALAILTSMLCRSYHLRKKTAFLICLSYTVLFAATDEFHQLFVDGRSGSVKDIVLDSFGALTGILIYDCVDKFWATMRNKKI